MKNDRKSPVPPALLIGLLFACVALLLILRRSEPAASEIPPPKETAQHNTLSSTKSSIVRHTRSAADAPTLSAEEIVAKKLSQFAGQQRAIFEAMARKKNVAVPGDVKRFFDAIAANNWPEASNLYKSLRQPDNPSGSRSDDIRPFWRAIQDTYGAAMMAQRMPAQQYLDYGNSILNSLQPGMIYVGGTDSGMFIPNMLNATSDGDQHVILTQNGLADMTYLNYLSSLYGDQLKMLTSDDSQQAFQKYYADAQQRFQHAQQFPDEPKQVRPGEDIKMQDGKLSISGQVAVMGINENLLQTLMQKNPDMSFALEESYPLKSTYGGAVPLGPIMQLNAPGTANAFTADTATQTVAFWQNTTQQLLADPSAAGSADTLVSYSHDALAQANLLAAHDFPTQAEQAYNLASQLSPTNFDAIAGLSDVLYHNGKSDQALQVLNDFAQKNPNLQSKVDSQRSALTAKVK